MSRIALPMPGFRLHPAARAGMMRRMMRPDDHATDPEYPQSPEDPDHVDSRQTNGLESGSTSSEPPHGPPASSGLPGPSGTPGTDRIGPFTLIRVIGVGGMGTVFEALQDEPRRAVALKVMRVGAAMPSALRRFKTEAEALGQLKHDSIARIYAAETHGRGAAEVPYIAMELIGRPSGPGGRTGTNAPDLVTYATRQGLSIIQKLELMARVCDAVQHAHTRNFIHRDLKPANILIDEDTPFEGPSADGSGRSSPLGTPKVIDFGVARAIGSQDGDAAPGSGPIHTTQGQAVGTLAYMSPEQAMGDVRRIDGRTDVYALGAILYELLTGRLPYDLSNLAPDLAAAKIRSATPPDPGRLDPRLRGDVGNIVLKALRKDRAERYQSAGEMRDDLRRIISGSSALARRPGPMTEGYRRTRRAVGVHPRLATAAAVILSAGIGFGVFFSFRNEWLHGHWQHLLFAQPMSMREYSKVCLLAVDEAFDAAPVLARAGFPDLDPQAGTSMRVAFAELISTRLAYCDIPAIGFDIVFRPNDPEIGVNVPQVVTERLAEAISGVVHRPNRIPVVVTYDEFLPGQARPVFCSELFDAGVMWGTSRCVVPEDSGWALSIYDKEGQADPRPGFSLVLAAAALHPQHAPSYRWDNSAQAVEVSFTPLNDPNAGPERDKSMLVRADDELLMRPEFDFEDQASVGIEAGDPFGMKFVRLPGDSCMRESTLPVSEALEWTPERLNRWINGRVVIISNVRETDGEPRLIYPDGREVIATYINLSGVEALRGGASVVLLGWKAVGLSACVGAIAGALIGWLARSSWMRIGFAAALVTVVIVGEVMAFRIASLLISPFQFVVATLLSLGLCAWIVSARRARIDSFIG